MIRTREVLTAVASMLAGSLMTYGLKAVAVEGRVSGVEHSLMRIEAKLDRIDIELDKK